MKKIDISTIIYYENELLYRKDRIDRRVPNNNLLKGNKGFYKERTYKKITKLKPLRDNLSFDFNK